MNDLCTGRKALRLRHFDYSESAMCFVTFCTHGRACVFGSVIADEMVLSEIGHIVEAGWKQLASHEARIGLDTFVILPNHLHGVVVLEGPEPGAMDPMLVESIRLFKARCVHACRGVRQDAHAGSRWQKNYFEQAICNEADLTREREYLTNKPAQWALDHENPGAVSAIDSANVVLLP